MKVLIAEDDRDFGSILSQYVTISGFDVTLGRDGKEAWDLFCQGKYDMCVFDVMMPEMDGFTTCIELRKRTDVPVVLLTALNRPDDIVHGFSLGADDYITKPFDSEVLLHKIKAILKRNQDLHDKNHAQIEFQIGSYHFNSKLRTLKHGDSSHTLSPKENELLLMLCEYKNDLLPREAALKKIWGSDTYFNGRSMDVYIAKLRKYLKEDSSIEIVNIHGNGFRLVVTE